MAHSKLFSAIEIDGLRLPNRIVIPPMCQYSADECGLPSHWHYMHYGSLAFSGAGLLIMEAMAISPEGRVSLFDLGLWNDQQRDALQKLLNALRQYSSLPLAVQLAHAGRKAAHDKPWLSDRPLSIAQGGWLPVAPCALPYRPEYPLPHELSLEEIQAIMQKFAAAALRAHQAGFDAIELHSAHGYLMHEFLSPVTNRRKDSYGGSLQKRMRFVLQTFQAVREVFPGPVGVRISGTDWLENGWNLADSIVLSQRLEEMGCAYIHVSGGGLCLNQQMQVGPGYQTHMAEQIKAAVKIPVIAVGLITHAQQAEHILMSQQADLVAIGRALLYNPRWPWHAAAQLGEQVDAPPQYWRAQPRNLNELFRAIQL